MSTLPPRPRVEFFTGIHTGDHFRVGVRCWGSMPDDLRFALVDSRGNAVAHEEKVTGKVTATRTREQAKQKKVSVPRKGDGSTVYFPRFMPRDDWANEPLRLVLYKSTNQEHLCELKLGRIARKTHSTTQATTEVLIEKLREIADLTEEERDRLSVHHWMLVTARSFLLYKLLTNDTAHKRSIRAEEDEVLAAELRKPPERFGAWLDYLIKVGDKKAWENGYLLLITDEKVEAQRLLPRPGDFLLRPSYRFANERVIMVNVGGVLKKHRVRNRGPVPVLTLGDPCERMLVFAEGSYQTIPLNQVSPDVLAISSFSPYPDDTPQEGQGDRVHPLPPSPAAPVAPTPTPPTPTPIPALLPRAAPLPFWASLEWVADELEVGNAQEGQVEHLLYNEEPPLAAPVPAPRVAELEVGNAQEGQVEHLLYNEEPPLAAPAPAPRVAAAAIRPFSTLEAGVVQAGGWRFGPTKKRKLEPTPDVAAYEWHQGAYEDLDCGGTIDLQPPVGFPCAILPQDAQSVVVASPMDVSDHHTLQQLFPPKQQMVQMHGLNGLDGGDQGDRDLLLYEDNPPARFDFPARPIGA